MGIRRIYRGKNVIRRVGGLEVDVNVVTPYAEVIRRVGGLEVYASNAEKFGEVIRRVGGLKMFHHAHFSRSSAILPPGHWLLLLQRRGRFVF